MVLPRLQCAVAAVLLGSIVISTTRAGDAEDPPAAPDLPAAVKLYKQKNYDAALTALNALAASQPENPEVFYHLGRTAKRLQRLDEAVQWLERATRLDARNPEYFLALGDAYGAIASRRRSLSAANQTCNALEQAVALDPKSEVSRAAMIDFCRSAPAFAGGGMKKAYQHANELRALDAPAGTRLLITLLEREKKYGEAIAACAETLTSHPDDYSLLYAKGRLAAASGTEMDQGIAALEKCLTLAAPAGFPGHAQAHTRLAQLRTRKNEPGSARKHYEAALALEPELQEARAGLEALSP